jgi:putative alpha-1,2-mannosidase
VSCDLSPDDRASAFSHASEIARAHYYRVILDKYGVDVEFTPTDHASVFKFTFSKSGQAHILFDSVDAAPGALSINASSRTVQGHVDHNGPRLYFFASVDKEVNSSGVQPSSKATGWLQFEVTAGETVTMTMGTSFLSLAQARSNLDQEVGTKSFDQVKELAAAAWDKVLGKIEIEGATDEQRVTFYSNMYRLFLFPEFDVGACWRRLQVL